MPQPPAQDSPRAALARLALDTALAVEGVEGAVPGPTGTWRTTSGSDRLDGVVAVSLPCGRYGVSLHLVAGLVPLHPLADRVRDRIVRAAAKAGLGEALGPVDVGIEDIASSAPSTSGSHARPPAATLGGDPR